MSVPAPNKPIADKNNPRVVKRSIKKAEIGIITPFAIKKAVVIHCTSPVVMEKYSCIEGRAAARGDEVIIPINHPVNKAAIMNPFCFAGKSHETLVGSFFSSI